MTWSEPLRRGGILACDEPTEPVAERRQNSEPDAVGCLPDISVTMYAASRDNRRKDVFIVRCAFQAS